MDKAKMFQDIQDAISCDVSSDVHKETEVQMMLIQQYRSFVGKVNQSSELVILEVGITNQGILMGYNILYNTQLAINQNSLIEAKKYANQINDIISMDKDQLVKKQKVNLK
jgi:hypothetical protein